MDAEQFGQQKRGRKKKLRSKEWLLKRKKDLESKDAKIKSEAEMSDVLPALCNSF